MPWTEAQHKYFCALAHGMKSRKKGAPSREEAKRMCDEGVKKGGKRRKVVRRGSK